MKKIIIFILFSVFIITLSSCSKNYSTGDIVVQDGVKYQFIDPQIENGYMENIPDYNKETDLAYHRVYPIDMLNETSATIYAETERSVSLSSTPNFRLELYQFGSHYYTYSSESYYEKLYPTMGRYFELYILEYFTVEDLGFAKPGFYVMGLEDTDLNSIRIPLTVKDYPVLGIGEHAFTIDKDFDICIEGLEKRRFNIMPYAFSKAENTNPTLKITGENKTDDDNYSVNEISLYCHSLIFPMAFQDLNLVLEKQYYCCFDLAFYNCNILKLDGKYECLQCSGFYKNSDGMNAVFNTNEATCYNMFYYPLGHPVLNPIFYNTKVEDLNCYTLEHYTNDDNIYYFCHNFHIAFPYFEQWYEHNNNDIYGAYGRKAQILMSNFPTENLYISYYYLLNYVDIVNQNEIQYNYLKTFVGNEELYKNAKNIVITSPDKLEIRDNKVYVLQDWYIEQGRFPGLNLPIPIDYDNIINTYFIHGLYLTKPIEILVIPNTSNAKVTIVDGLENDDGYESNLA